ncbi:MAG: hypothetical protein EAY75_11070 [Bacteroidetes bacterium]|nr:MAG: hypothetical protein EAY75_11070 [Bacteroidota bacterium]
MSAFLSLAIILSGKAQEVSPVSVMEQAFKTLEVLNQKYLIYTSAAAHSSARKSERKYRDYMEQIDESNAALSSVPSYKGDRSLQNGIREYLKLVRNVMSENYSKVVNMEEIAEKSYDNMEAYLLMNKQLDEKMSEASAKLNALQKDYCVRNNITLVENTTEQSNKMDKLGDVMDYKNENYLIFFKCAYQNDVLLEAVEANNVVAMEQARTALKKYAEEGLAKMDTMKNFKGDPTLKMACKNALQFFKREADKAAIYTDYAMKEKAFLQQKKAFESNAKARSDNAEIDKFNKAVDDFNKAGKELNEAGNALNKERAEAYNNYNKATTTFLDTHVPYAKK